MNILRISPLTVVALICALLLFSDLDTTRAQLTSPSDFEVSSGTVVFPEDDDEIVDESAPPLAFLHPPNGRRDPPNGQRNSRFPHPVDTFLKPFEPLFNGAGPNFFHNPEPNFNIHHHYNQHGGSFQSQGPPPPLPPPQQIPPHLNFPGPPIKRPQKNPIKFPSDLPPGNHFNHDQRPLLNNNKRFKKPTVNRQFKVIQPSCEYKGVKYNCGLSLACTLAGGLTKDLCNGGPLWQCCVPKSADNENSVQAPVFSLNDATSTTTTTSSTTTTRRPTLLNGPSLVFFRPPAFNLLLRPTRPSSSSPSRPSTPYTRPSGRAEAERDLEHARVVIIPHIRRLSKQVDKHLKRCCTNAGISNKAQTHIHRKPDYGTQHVVSVNTVEL